MSEGRLIEHHYSIYYYIWSIWLDKNMIHVHVAIGSTDFGGKGVTNN